MDPAISPRSPPNPDVIAARKKWSHYCRRAFTSFRDKSYSAMSRITMFHFATYARNMHLLTTYTDALGAHASENIKLHLATKRHRSQVSLAALATLRSHAASRRGSAAVQRLRHGRIVARARQVGPAKYGALPRRSASLRSLRSFRSAFTSADSQSARRSSSSVREVSPQARVRREVSRPADNGHSQNDEMAHLKAQLARVTSDLDKMAATVEQHKPMSAESDHEFAQAVQDSLGEAALSPVRARSSEPASVDVAQDQLCDQLAVLAAAKARAIERRGAEKDVWDKAMHRRIMPAGHNDSDPAPRECDELAADMTASIAASLLTAAQENSAFEAAKKK